MSNFPGYPKMFLMYIKIIQYSRNGIQEVYHFSPSWIKKAFSLPWLGDQIPLEASVSAMHTAAALQGVLEEILLPNGNINVHKLETVMLYI